MRNVILIILPIFLISLSLKGQEKWTLEKCINYAIENNIQVKIQELSTKNANSAYFKSKMSFLPNLNGSASQNYSLGRSIDPLTNQFAESNVSSNNFSFSSSITLFNGLQNYNTIQKNNIDFKENLEYFSDRWCYERYITIRYCYNLLKKELKEKF